MSNNVPIPARRPLYPHQEKALEYARQHDHVGFVLEMRLGKTLTAIRWAQELRPVVRTCIVVAPLTVLDAWERELRAEGECFISCYGLPLPDRQDRVCLVASTTKGRRWLLINYEAVMATPFIFGIHWDVVIADESSSLRSVRARRSKAFCAGFREVGHRAILTGLIRPESDEDVFMQMKFLRGEFMGHTNFYRWRVRHFRKGWDGYSWVPTPEGRERIKKALHEAVFVLTRDQAGMHKQKIHAVRNITMTSLQRKMYKQAENEFAMALESGQELETQWVIVMRNWLQKLTGGFDPKNGFVSPAKKNELLSLMAGELQGQKVVISFAYRHELAYIRDALTDAGIDVVTVLGGDPMEERILKMEQFRKNPVTLGFLATEKVFRFGIDVSVASTMIHYSSGWSCEDRAQSEDRILHPAKFDPLLYIDLVCKGTIDEDLLKAVRSKKARSDVFMDVTRNLLRRRGVPL